MGCKRIGKRKRGCRLVEDDDLMYLILSFVNLKTLFTCSNVSKSWNSLIKSLPFRRLWCSNGGSKEPYWIVAGCYDYIDHCYCWNSSTGCTWKLQLPDSRPLHYASVVASAGGLLCVRCKPQAGNFELEGETTVDMLVGNPVTGAWKELPGFKWDIKDIIYDFTIDHRMMVYDGGFKVCIQLLGPNLVGHYCCVYDSATNAWRQTSMKFSCAYLKAREERLDEHCDLRPVEDPELNAFYYDSTIASFYDMACDKWSRGKLRSLELTTGLECTSDKKRTCVLPRPGHSTFRLWEYMGEQYFVSSWVYAGGLAELRDDSVDGFGVWKVNQEGRLVLVSARIVWDVYSELAFKDICFGIFPVQTDADGNLVCFSGLTQYIVTYNLSTDCWGGIKLCHDLNLRRLEYSVVYQPSLRPVN